MLAPHPRRYVLRGLVAATLVLSMGAPALADKDRSSSSGGRDQNGAATPAVDAAISSPDAAAERNAAAPANLAEVKAKGAREIARRQETLAKLAAELASSPKDCGSNGAAAARVSATQIGLGSLGAQLAATQDLATARALYSQIFTHWRVYLLVNPMARIVVACDQQLVRIDRLAATATQLQSDINAAKARGVDTSAADALLTASRGVWPQAQATATAAAGTVVVLVPDLGVVAVLDANKAAIGRARDGLKASDRLLDTSAKQLSEARRELNAATKAATRATRVTRVTRPTVVQGSRSSDDIDDDEDDDSSEGRGRGRGRGSNG